jgi:hypothetical protein
VVVIRPEWRVERQYVRVPELESADRFRAFQDLILKGALRAARSHQPQGVDDERNECASLASPERR